MILKSKITLFVYLFICLFVYLFICFGSANADIITVDARVNSSIGGSSGAGNISLLTGQSYRITADSSDLWNNAYPYEGWSNANGLSGDFYGLGTGVADANGDIPGGDTSDLIGKSWGLYTQNGLTTFYGTLVGQIDDGPFFKIGTNYSFTPTINGTLRLYNFDIAQGDNLGSINVDVSPVPEPEEWAMMMLGFPLMGWVARRKQAANKAAIA